MRPGGLLPVLPTKSPYNAGYYMPMQARIGCGSRDSSSARALKGKRLYCLLRVTLRVDSLIAGEA